MDTANWPRELGMAKSNQPLLEEPQVMEMKKPAARPPHKEQALNCPRCNSTNTKFCYYNNYSLTQPRYFCKTCRRYWTEGGSLRNVPVGGGSRKNKRSNPNPNPNPNPTTAPSIRKLAAPPDLAYPPPQISLSSSSQNPKFLEGQDLNLSFPQFDAYPNHNHNHNPSPNPNNPSMELFKGMQAFMPGGLYSSGYGMQDFRPQTSNFPIHGGGYEGLQENAGRMLFPFEDLKPVPPSSAADQFEQNRGQGGEQTTGFWNTMIGGGGNW